MADRLTTITAPLARWSSRIALFSASVLLVGVVLHRLTSFPTAVAVNMFAVSVVGSALAILVGLIALIQIWRRGYGGAGSAAFGILLPLLSLAWPLTFVPAFFKLPPINDISTDLTNPPKFMALAKQRTGSNSADYPGTRFAPEQQKAYPDLRTFMVDLSPEEAFDLVEEVARKLKWRVVTTQTPTAKPPKGGVLEATDQTMVIGFTDDVAVRVEGAGKRSRVDIRSASRFGEHDLGQNAARVRRFLVELQSRVDSTAPTAIAGRRSLRTTRAGAMVKKVKGSDPKKGESKKDRKAESRGERARAQSNAQRAQARKE
jgi:uncharacterized protein (DUF1499 family)